MAEIAAATERIRVGSGGIMLPNHAPYVVAEQFGTLNAFHPGRIDLGVGRAPGTDPMTAAALRRDDSAAMSFPAEVQQLQRFLGEPSPMHRVHAIPGQGLEGAPVHSGFFPVRCAACRAAGSALRVRFAFCARNAAGGGRHLPRKLQALGAPGTALRHGGCNRNLADTDERARYLYTSQQQHFLGVVRGNLSFAPPVEDMDAVWTGTEKMHIERMTAEAIVGSPATAQARIEDLVARTGADELIVMTEAWEHEDRLRSYELLSQLPVVRRAS